MPIKVRRLLDLDPLELKGIQFDLTDPSTPAAEGLLVWNSTDGTLELGMPGGNVNLQIGQEQLIYVRNISGSTITNGSVVYVSGVSNNQPKIDLADAALASVHRTVGLATEDIDHNSSGYVTTFGLVRSVNTNAFSVGDEVYVSATAGGLTDTEPVYPAYSVSVGVILVKDSTDGVIFVSIHPDIWKTDIYDNLTPYERHVQVDAKAVGNVSNQPTPVDVGTTPVAGFQFASAGPQQELHFQWEVPDDWDGTDVVVEIDWLPDSGAMTNPAAVKWVFEYVAVAVGESVDKTVSSQSVTYDTTTAQYVTVHSPVTFAFNDANNPLTKQDHVYVRCYRDTGVANDFSGTVVGTAFEILYNSVGLPTSN